MLKLCFLLYYEFLKIGVFAIGGGYAAIPFLYYLQPKYNWFTLDELTNMIAVSNITPGPVGINMATYTGFTTAGLSGAITATLAIVSVPFVFTIAMTKLIDKFQTYKAVESVFKGLKPAACALLASISIKLLYQSTVLNKTNFYLPTQIDVKAVILFIILIIPFSFMKKNPLLAIVAGAIGGIIIQSF